MGDFYCDEVLTGRLEIDVVLETDDVLAFHHTRPAYEHHSSSSTEAAGASAEKVAWTPPTG